jgi:hypothetical protein
MRASANTYIDTLASMGARRTERHAIIPFRINITHGRSTIVASPLYSRADMGPLYARAARRYALILAIVPLLLQLGCGATAQPAFHGLPSNIMAQPRGSIGVVTHETSSSLMTAFRAMGIPYHLIPLQGAARQDLSNFQILFIDEGTLDEDAGFAAYGHAIETVTKFGSTLVVMHQPTDALTKAMRRVPYKLHSRDVDYKLLLSLPRKDDPMTSTPNRITRIDLDSLGTRTTQLVYGDRAARAIISSNLDSPDSSAVMLWQPLEQGAVWYFSVPLADYAAAGHEAAQKIIANLVTNR